MSGNWSTFVSNGAIYTLPYDLVRDFEPVVLLPSNSHLIAARKTLLAGDLSALVAWLKANQDKVSMATAGVGTGSHFAAVLLQSLTGTTFPLLHYRGGGPALQDLLSGQVDLMSNQAAVFLPHARAGTIGGRPCRSGADASPFARASISRAFRFVVGGRLRRFDREREDLTTDKRPAPFACAVK